MQSHLDPQPAKSESKRSTTGADELEEGLDDDDREDIDGDGIADRDNDAGIDPQQPGENDDIRRDNGRGSDEQRL